MCYRRRFADFTGSVLIVLAVTSTAATDDCCDVGSVVGPIGPLQKLATGFAFTEGPASDGHGNLYFTDLKDGRGKIYKLNGEGILSLFRAYSNRANGLMVNALGEVVACEADGKVTAYSPDGCSRRVLADGYHGKHFNAPNDLVIDRFGGIYFTDPFFGAPRLLPPQRRSGVYYLSPSGAVTRLIDDLANPNGIVLSPDESTLYVIPSGQRTVMAYPVLAPGCLGPGRVFCRLAPSWFLLYPGGDGATVDSLGNLYVTSMRGVQVFSPTGQPIGILRVPENPSNVTFGGPYGRTLYITAETSLYAAEMAVAGHRHGAIQLHEPLLCEACAIPRGRWKPLVRLWSRLQGLAP